MKKLTSVKFKSGSLSKAEGMRVRLKNKKHAI